MILYIPYIVVFIVSILKAIADTCQDHFYVSIFKTMNPLFWNKTVSWGSRKFLGIVVLDAWHLCFYGIFTLLFTLPYLPHNKYDIILFWLIYFITFESFYSKILIKKQ